MKSAVIAARDNEPGDSRLKLTGFNGDLMTSDPEYEAPLVKELELVLVVFDILYVNGQVHTMFLTALSQKELGMSGYFMDDCMWCCQWEVVSTSQASTYWSGPTLCPEAMTAPMPAQAFEHTAR